MKIKYGKKDWMPTSFMIFILVILISLLVLFILHDKGIITEKLYNSLSTLLAILVPIISIIIIRKHKEKN